ncbi:hypothetical protein A5690_24715 [Mycobacterium intracellulare]|uniref:hypothetical protein n=1 Tax=Mycobacterium intracellulare TaxID=1767 RepID=UPI0007EBA1B0|nr:hypothetical protein [Mycobacterium intracellulare]OBH40527.1 hypothetical protein A5690_24715 [Mycobacterium intracellulare]
MTIRRTRSRGQMLALGAAGAVVATSMLGEALLSAPQAAAACNMTPKDDQYINLLAQNKMIHSAEFNDCNMTAEGRWFADQVRSADNPLAAGKRLVNMVTNTTPLKPDQAEWEVESAIFVYAPEMIPAIKGQAAQASSPA